MSVNLSDEKNISGSNLIYNEEIPEDIINAQKNENIEQKHRPRVHLFFSFDIVNSTLYKTMTGNWPIIIRGLLEDIKTQVLNVQELMYSYLWRVIGDEMIFVLLIQSEKELPKLVDSIFEVTQHVALSLKTGKFFDSLENQRLQKSEIEILKTQNLLSIKAAAWLAVLNDDFQTPYDNISFNYMPTSNNQVIREFLGKDIDAGFRLKMFTQDRRLALSFELAYFIFKFKGSSNLFILDYVTLKGVWNGALYPLIWYYDEGINGICYKEITGKDKFIKFDKSFRYDEIDNNQIVKNYFLRRGIVSGQMAEYNFGLSEDMYNIESALNRIIDDRNLADKLKYMESLLSDEVVMSKPTPYPYPLELHCAVVCCDVDNRKVMITHRGMEHIIAPGKWEFGCAKINGESKLVDNITTYYKDAFGIEIELVIDNGRLDDRQPIPIAVYEINAKNAVKKGIIFVAKVLNPKSTTDFRKEKSHDEIRWISEDEIKDYKKEDIVSDFHDTLSKVFSRFDEFFSEKNERFS